MNLVNVDQEELVEVGSMVKFRDGRMAGFLIKVVSIFTVNDWQVCDLEIYCGSIKQLFLATIEELIPLRHLILYRKEVMSLRW